MRTLYVRIIMTTMFIMIASGCIAFLVTNVYYHHYLKPGNDRKVTHIAQNVVNIFEESGQQDIESYLSAMTDLGYTFHLFDEDGYDQTFGDQVLKGTLSSKVITTVLNGEVYHGIKNYPWKPFVTGFFNSEISNTIGVPIQTNDHQYALFVRPHSVQQFGEMRFFLAVLLMVLLLFSFIGIVVSTRFIVKPIKDLMLATRKIAAGNYHIKLNVNRTDEIGKLARDFTKMSDSLEKTEDKRQEFVSSVSHEIQSPLTSIQGFSQALQEEDLSKDEQRHYLSIIEKESRRLSQLSNQLLTLSFLDSDVDEDTRLTFDLLAQVKEVISTVEWQWRKKELALEVKGDPVHITGDPKLLYQVWMNLLTNAIRYTNPGGTIAINIQEEPTHVKVTFRDTGIGIAEKDIGQIFDRFYKVDKARTRSEGSTGLGLSIAKKIIELHKGTIMVESERNEGSIFTITLPVIPGNK